MDAFERSRMVMRILQDYKTYRIRTGDEMSTVLDGKREIGVFKSISFAKRFIDKRVEKFGLKPRVYLAKSEVIFLLKKRFPTNNPASWGRNSMKFLKKSYEEYIDPEHTLIFK